MAKIIFQTDRIKQDVPDGSKIILIAEEIGASLSFGCREASCGTCRVYIVEGRKNLKPFENDETLVLGQEKINEGYRLGCQLVIKSGQVIIRNA